MSFSLVLMVRSCRNMKICLRYLSPKSPFSERGLAIAPLQSFVLVYILLIINNLGEYPAFLAMQDTGVIICKSTRCVKRSLDPWLGVIAQLQDLR